MNSLQRILSRPQFQLGGSIALLSFVLLCCAAIFIVHGDLRLLFAILASVSAFGFLCSLVMAVQNSVYQAKADIVSTVTAGLGREMMDLRSRLDDLAEKERMAAVMAAAIGRTATDHHEQLASGICGLAQDLSELGQRLSAVEGHLLNADGVVSGLLERVSSAQVKLSGIDQRMLGVASGIASVSGQLSSVEEFVSDAGNQLGKAHNALAADILGLASSVHRNMDEMGAMIVKRNEDCVRNLIAIVENGQVRMNGLNASMRRDLALIQETSATDASRIEQTLSQLFEAVSADLALHNEKLGGVSERLYMLRVSGDAGFSDLHQRMERDLALFEKEMAALDNAISEVNSLVRGSLSDLLDGQTLVARNAEEGILKIEQGIAQLAGGLIPQFTEMAGVARSISERIDTSARAIEGCVDDLAASTQEQNVELHQALDVLAGEFHDAREKLLATTVDEHWLRGLVRRGFGPMKVEIVQEVEALLQLRRVLDVDHPVALLGGWAMEPVSVLGIVKLILERKPKLVVELGGGASTIWIGYALRKAGGGKIISVDHLSEFRDRTEAALRQHGLQHYAETRLAPLRPVNIGEETFNWYCIDMFEDVDAIDIVLVDGPPAKSGPAARYPAIPVLRDHLHDGALVVLDDADRIAESKIAKRWLRENDKLEFYGNIGERTRLYQWN